MHQRRWALARSRIRALCDEPGPERVLRAAVLAEIRAAIPFDYYVWLGTDPVTAVGAAPLAEVPVLADLPRLIRLKYATPVNRWTTLPHDRASTLLGTTGGDLSASLMWREMLAGYGVRDVASVVLRDRHGCWGFLDLHRSDGPFDAAEQDALGSVLPELTLALRRAVAATFVARTDREPPAGPAVLLLSPSLVPLTQTPTTDAQLRALLPTPPQQQPVPAVAFNVAAQLLAVEAGVDDAPPTARLHQGDGRWVSVRAARLAPGTSDDPAIAVTVEESAPAERAEICCRALGLTVRETEIVRHLVAGIDTRGTARALGIVEHTVTDHLKSIFAKSGTNSRAQLVARITG